MMKDYILIKQIQKKNKVVFKKCYDLYFKDLVSYANKYLFDYQSSEDIVQEVFIYLWQHAESIKIKVSLKSYLVTMVKNRCLNYLKSIKITDNKNYIELSDSLNIYTEIKANSFSSDNESYIKVLKIIDSMPIKMQKIFKLKFMNNYTYKEIAEELNVSINTVKTQLKRAKIKISESLVILVFLLLKI